MPSRRTRLVSAALALALLGTIAAAALLAPRSSAPPPAFVPPERSGVIALDVSASVSQDAYGRIEAALRGLARSGGRYGLVVFSDTAYEALPPGTPARELERFADIFHVPPARQDAEPSALPPNPWTRTFVGGTRLSAGLRLAGEALAGSGARDGAVILISDLDDDPTDAARLVATVLSLRGAGVPVRVIGLNPSSDDARYFQALLSRKGSVHDAPAPADQGAESTAAASSGSSPFPTALVALALAFAAALALNEWWCARLTWRPSRAGRRP